MGMPDKLFFCRRGHLYDVIAGGDWESDGKETCLCGEKDIVNFSSYGEENGVHHPVDAGVYEPPIKRIGKETFRVRVPFKVYDAAGNELEAYHDHEVEVWDVSQLFAAPQAPEPAPVAD